MSRNKYLGFGGVGGVFLKHYHNWVPLMVMNCLRHRKLLRTFAITMASIF